MRPHIPAGLIEDNARAVPDAVAGHDLRELRGGRHHEGQGILLVHELAHEIGEATARDMPLGPGLAATVKMVAVFVTVE